MKPAWRKFPGVGKVTPTMLEGWPYSEDAFYDFEERAGIAEYCGNLPREDAEKLAWFALHAPPPQGVAP